MNIRTKVFHQNLKELHIKNGELNPFLKNFYNKDKDEFDLDKMLKNKIEFILEMGNSSIYLYEIIIFYFKIEKHLKDEISIYKISDEEIFNKERILDKIFELYFLFHFYNIKK